MRTGLPRGGPLGSGHGILCPRGRTRGRGRFLLALATQQRGHFPAQGKKFEFLGQSPAFRHIQRPYLQVAQGQAFAGSERQGGQLTPDEHILEMAAHLVLNFGRQQDEMVPDVLQTGADLEDLARGLGADARHAGNIVAGVAHQGLHVGPLGRADPALGPEFGFVEELFLARRRIPHIDVGTQALFQILVAADDDHRVPGRKAGRQGGDAVIGLAALGDFQLEAQGVHHAQDGLDLPGQILGHGVAVGLVQRKDVVTKIFALAVLDEDEMTGPLLAQNAQQHTGHHHQGVGGEPVGTLHIFIGEKAAVNEGGTVHQKYGIRG